MPTKATTEPIAMAMAKTVSNDRNGRREILRKMKVLNHMVELLGQVFSFQFSVFSQELARTENSTLKTVHSCHNASVGNIRAARAAGARPPSRPTPTAIRKP